VAVLGNRGTGILDMLIEGYKRSGVDMEQPNMSPVGRTPLQTTLNRPQMQLSSQGGVMATTMPDNPFGAPVEASTVPMIQDLARGRILDSNNPMRDVGQPMPVQQAVAREQARQSDDPMGMQKLAEDAAKVQEAINDNPQLEQDSTFMDKVKKYFGNRENMAKLALAFNSMRLSPDAGLAASLGQELKDIRATRADEELRNRTAAYFAKTDPKIAAAMMAGLSAKDAIALSQDKNKGVVVGKMIVNPRTGDIIYDGSKEGSDLPDSVQKIMWGAKQLGLTPGTDEYKDYITSQFSKSKGMSFRVRKDGTIEFTEGGELGSLTEGQGKGLMFSQRMGASQKIINTVENEGTSIFNAIVSNVPFAGNLLTSPEYKLYEQAKRDFINAQLRFESGAAIAPSEFANADKQYFPQPGDTPEVIAQKRANRELAIQTMNAVSGPDAEAYAKNIRVKLFGPRAADWPDAGTVIDDPDNPGTKLRFKGGDPDIDSNWSPVQ